jgi:hypothetical protein
MSEQKDDLKMTWKERWDLAIIALIAGMSFQIGQWIVDMILPNPK